MILVFEEDDISGNVTVKVSFNRRELIPLKFDHFSYRLFEECSNSNKISDKLLALEYLARKLEEYHAKNKKGN